MNRIKNIVRWLSTAVKPWKENFSFAVMMYLLGCLTAWITLPHTRNAHLYETLFSELFFDISVLCLVLTLVGKRMRPWLRGAFYAVAYVVALVDAYCFVTYDTTLTPTVMMLLSETDSREAGEFIQTLFSANLVFSKVGLVLLLMMAHIALGIFGKKLKVYGEKWVSQWLATTGKCHNLAIKCASHRQVCTAVIGGLLLVGFLWAGGNSWPNKRGVYRLLTAKNIGQVEHILTEKDHGTMYQPIYRLAFSFYANSLTAEQIEKLRKAAGRVKVDSCSFTSPTIVLIIGESYSRHHSQQYGYWQPTTPRQVDLEKTGRLAKFTDVVSPWNLTSFVFKLLFSTYTVGEKGEWCDYPLFPELFRAAGYHVTFLTNQFLPQAKEAVYDFSGGFFLNDAVLSKAQFDTRNTKLHYFDEDLVKEYADPKNAKAELAIFHLKGQHVVYYQRSPKSRKHFKKEEYEKAKPHLNDKERRTLADYDNAILYNDSIVNEIVRRFDKKEAIILYVPDHGEECYEGDLHFYCRMHSATIDSRLAHAEFDIPFWIYCTPSYIKKHPEIYQQVQSARNHRYMTDALPHLLLYLAGIHCKDYKDSLNLLSPNYNEKRTRLLKNTTDYDALDK